MLILRNDPAGMATFTIERVRVLVLPPPIKVEITIKGGDGAKTRLEPLETRQELPGPGGPATWNEAVLAELTAACGIDPEGLDIRHLDRMLEDKTVRARLLEIDGEHVLVGAEQ